jgi:hypothetical protein
MCVITEDFANGVVANDCAESEEPKTLDFLGSCHLQRAGQCASRTYFERTSGCRTALVVLARVIMWSIVGTSLCFGWLCSSPRSHIE